MELLEGLIRASTKGHFLTTDALIFLRQGLASAGGIPFETVLIFRVATPSRFFEGAERSAFPSVREQAR